MYAVVLTIKHGNPLARLRRQEQQRTMDPASTMASNRTDTFNEYADRAPSTYWETYSRGRPSVPPSFWQRLIAYHTEQGNGQFSHVHDLGSGPGIHAFALAKYFHHVTLTDPSSTNIEAAKAQLSQRGDAERYTFRVGRGEDALEPTQQTQYDMVFLANALHWMDAPKAIENVAASLKSSGTFAAALFGVPDDFADGRARDAFLEWLRLGVDLIFEQRRDPSFASQVVAQDSGYDSVEMDSKLWESVTRVRLNTGSRASRGFATDKVLRAFEGKHSAVTETETILDEDDKDWYVTTDLDGLRDMISTFPVPSTPEAEKKLWDILEEIYESKPVEVRYGVRIILATKR